MDFTCLCEVNNRSKKVSGLLKRERKQVLTKSDKSRCPSKRTNRTVPKLTVGILGDGPFQLSHSADLNTPVQPVAPDQS